MALALGAGPALAAPCSPTATRLCLNDYRFTVEVAWTVPGLGSGVGHAVPLTGDTGLFWFFGNPNLELVIKMLDGRPVNGHFWVYWGGLSDVEYTITVTDTKTGAREVYPNPPGQLASRADTAAFAAEPAPAAVAFGALGEQPAAAAAPSLAPVPLRQGPEFPVNVTTQGSQWDPSVAIGPDGGFMVVWAGEADVFGRLYDATGQPRSGEFRLSSAGAGTGYGFGARVAASPTGEFMAVWTADGNRAMARVFDPDGQPLGDEFRLGASPRFQSYPAVVADPAGGFLVAWPDGGDSAASIAPSLRWQRFDRRGSRVGVESAINRFGGDLRVTAFPAGGFLLAWLEPAGDFETDVLALRLDATGVPTGNTALRANIDAVRHPGYHQQPVPVTHADGRFSIVWSTLVFGSRPGTQGLFARSYGASGNPTGGVVTLQQGDRVLDWPHTAAALPSGETLVLWSEYGRPQDPDGGLFGQVFDSSWAPRGGDFRINTYTEYLQIDPAVAVDGAGNLVAAWSSGLEPLPILTPPGWGSGTQDGHLLGVFAQRFTTATCALDPGQLCLGGRFRVAVQFTSPWTGSPEAGHAVPLTADTGAFWFFGESNVELIVKILDGQAVNGHFWLYAGALSDVEYTITVTDTETGKTKTYHNGRGRLASRADIEAF
jgi:hypothetical protein